MSESRVHVVWRRLGVVVGLLACALVFAACGAKTPEPDLVAGKQQFVAKCGSCHTLARANTKGTQGPNLDEAFQQAQKEGFGDSAIRGVVATQIEYPSRGLRACEPDCVPMPADLVTGDAVHDVAAYVALVAGKGGRDEGRLASAVQAAGSGKPIAAKDGVVSIPADPGGQLAYVSKLATAPAGPLKVQSPNESSTPHDIVIDGKGAGKEVSNGGVSEFEANFTPGSYTYYCSVPGHRQAGMEGKLAVK